MAILTEADVLRLVEREARIMGTAKLAKKLGLSTPYLINLRKGRVGIGPRLLAAMQLETVYRECLR